MHRNTFYGIALAVVALDQLVKAWVRVRLPLGKDITLWPGVFYLQHEQNHGMAFSLFNRSAFAIPLLSVAALVVVGAIIWAQRRMGNRIPTLLGWSLALPLGGAIGNCVDRIRQGYVTDLFDFRLINFPVFNVADAAITVGIVLLAWRTLVVKEPEIAPRSAIGNAIAGDADSTPAA